MPFVETQGDEQSLMTTLKALSDKLTTQLSGDQPDYEGALETKRLYEANVTANRDLIESRELRAHSIARQFPEDSQRHLSYLPTGVRARLGDRFNFDKRPDVSSYYEAVGFGKTIAASLARAAGGVNASEADVANYNVLGSIKGAGLARSNGELIQMFDQYKSLRNDPAAYGGIGDAEASSLFEAQLISGAGPRELRAVYEPLRRVFASGNQTGDVKLDSAAAARMLGQTIRAVGPGKAGYVVAGLREMLAADPNLQATPADMGVKLQQVTAWAMDDSPRAAAQTVADTYGLGPQAAQEIEQYARVLSLNKAGLAADASPAVIAAKRGLDKFTPDTSAAGSFSGAIVQRGGMGVAASLQKMRLDGKPNTQADVDAANDVVSKAVVVEQLSRSYSDDTLEKPYNTMGGVPVKDVYTAFTLSPDASAYSPAQLERQLAILTKMKGSPGSNAAVLDEHITAINNLLEDSRMVKGGSADEVITKLVQGKRGLSADVVRGSMATVRNKVKDSFIEAFSKGYSGVSTVIGPDSQQRANTAMAEAVATTTVDIGGTPVSLGELSRLLDEKPLVDASGNAAYGLFTEDTLRKVLPAGITSLGSHAEQYAGTIVEKAVSRGVISYDTEKKGFVFSGMRTGKKEDQYLVGSSDVATMEGTAAVIGQYVNRPAQQLLSDMRGYVDYQAKTRDLDDSVSSLGRRINVPGLSKASLLTGFRDPNLAEAAASRNTQLRSMLAGGTGKAAVNSARADLYREQASDLVRKRNLEDRKLDLQERAQVWKEKYGTEKIASRQASDERAQLESDARIWLSDVKAAGILQDKGLTAPAPRE